MLFLTQMKNEFVKNIEEIGDVLFVYNKRAKRINLSLKPGGITRVSFPPTININRVESFVVSKKDWILEHQKKISAVQNKYLIDPKNELKTHYHEFIFTAQELNAFNATISNAKVDVKYPAHIEIHNTKLQEAFKTIIVKVLRKEAHFYLPNQLDILAKKHGFKYNQLRIKNIKSRWGSCSSLNNINLSLHVMTMPFHLIDFIILHELCHTIHRNHGKGFYKLLEKVSGNVDAFNKEVREHRIIWV